MSCLCLIRYRKAFAKNSGSVARAAFDLPENRCRRILPIRHPAQNTQFSSAVLRNQEKISGVQQALSVLNHLQATLMTHLIVIVKNQERKTRRFEVLFVVESDSGLGGADRGKVKLPGDRRIYFRLLCDNRTGGAGNGGENRTG